MAREQRVQGVAQNEGLRKPEGNQDTSLRVLRTKNIRASRRSSR